MPCLRPALFPLFCIALAVPALAAQLTDQEAVARKLINSQGCKACHPLEGAGGNSAPDLKEAGRRLSAEAIRSQLDNPQHLHGNGRIPDFHHLTPAEIDAIVWFLQQPSSP